MREGNGFAANDDVLDALLNISMENGKIEMDKDEIEHLLLVCNFSHPFKYLILLFIICMFFDRYTCLI